MHNTLELEIQASNTLLNFVSLSFILTLYDIGLISVIDQDKDKALSRFTWAIKPLIRCLITVFRIPYPLIEKKMRETAVDIATQHVASESESDPQLAQVALLAGLSPSVINQVKLEKSEAPRSSKYWAPEASIIDDWTSKTEWQDENGAPSVLPISGSYGAKNFPTLVRKCLGSIGHRHILKRLEDANCIKLTMANQGGKPRNSAELIKTTFAHPIGESVDIFCQSLQGIYHLSTTVSFNSLKSDLPASDRHFQQVVISRRISPDRIAEVRAIAKRLLGALVKSSAEEIQQLERRSLSTSDTEYASLGFNLSYFEDSDAPAAKDSNAT